MQKLNFRIVRRKIARKNIMASVASVALTLSLLPGCYTVNDRTTQVASEAYVEFVGATNGALFKLDKNGDAIVAPTPITTERFAVPPGAYVLSVDRAEVTVVRQRVLLTDGETLQIKVP